MMNTGNQCPRATSLTKKTTNKQKTKATISVSLHSMIYVTKTNQIMQERIQRLMGGSIVICAKKKKSNETVTIVFAHTDILV